MSTRDFLDLLHRKPFVPFRIITSDGTVYEVAHPELVMPGLSSVIIGYPLPQEPHAYSHYDVVSLRHVVRLEPREEPAEA